MKQDDPDYGITEEEFKSFVSPLSSGEKCNCDDITFFVYWSSLRKLLASYARCGSRIKHNLITKIKIHDAS